MKVLIENIGCDDTTYTEMELEENELNVLIKFAKENNKNSSYQCQPSIAIYKEYKKEIDDDGYVIFGYDYKKDIVEE